MVFVTGLSILQQKRFDLKAFGAAEQSARPRAARKLSIAEGPIVTLAHATAVTAAAVVKQCAGRPLLARLRR